LEREKNYTERFLSLSLSLSHVRAEYSLRQLTLVKDKTSQEIHIQYLKNKPHPNCMLSITRQSQTTHTPSDICDFCVREIGVGYFGCVYIYHVLVEALAN